MPTTARETGGPSRESREMLERLVAFDTTSHKSNLGLIEFARDYLKKLGAEIELIYDASGAKANLFATLGPADRGGVALSGHSDVVPVDGQEWSSDPWRIDERDGRLYGRGSADMKGFIAIALAWAPKFLARGLKTPVHFCLSHDEEVGCVGIPSLIEKLKTRSQRPRMVIVGEPTDMKVVTGHKGKLSYVCHAHGHECHSSLAPHGVNAIEAAARVVARLAEMAAERAEKGPFDRDYDVPFTTIHTGTIRGGTALNIVPADCSFEFEFRHLPNDDPRTILAAIQGYARSEIEPAMQARVAGTGFSWEEKSTIVGLDIDPGHEVVTFVKGLAGANATVKVAFGAEAGLFTESGMPAVLCGPGSIDQAHKPDEFVTLSQLAACETFMDRLAERLAA